MPEITICFNINISFCTIYREIQGVIVALCYDKFLSLCGNIMTLELSPQLIFE